MEVGWGYLAYAPLLVALGVAFVTAFGPRPNEATMSKALKMTYDVFGSRPETMVATINQHWGGLRGYTITVHRARVEEIPHSVSRVLFYDLPNMEIKFRTLDELKLKLDLLS